MITTVSIENAHMYGDIVPSILRLRHQGFKVRQNYAVPSYKRMEYDAYDNPTAVYLAWRDHQNIVRGCSRLISTAEPYMIEELWPDLVQRCEIPKSENIWEASRLCIDKSLPLIERKRIHAEILCAFQEYGLNNNIDWMIGVMPPFIWKTVFINAGWPIEFLGPIITFPPRERVVAGKMKISKKILRSLCERHNIYSPVLQNHIQEDLRRTA